jgi:hypothetical protein
MSTPPTPQAATVPYITAAPNLTAPVEGALLRQQHPSAARLSHILHRAATDLWDVCTYDDAAHMALEASAIADRIRAACKGA